MGFSHCSEVAEHEPAREVRARIIVWFESDGRGFRRGIARCREITLSFSLEISQRWERQENEFGRIRSNSVRDRSLGHKFEASHIAAKLCIRGSAKACG